ncbi:hypothetical protein C1646_812953 [Rhizophagus diaphanus]|nr:hypothetical protein C1646_812953 [Rhizophagus diaphanus] [Rhizophagus sp. MUCL 43196]
MMIDECFNAIAGEGYRLDKGNRFRYGKGIYSTPIIEIAENFATMFMHKGTLYKAVFQNRVNPEGFEEHYDVKYWVTPNEKDIRPYGLCVKKYSNDSSPRQIPITLWNCIQKYVYIYNFNINTI